MTQRSRIAAALALVVVMVVAGCSTSEDEEKQLSPLALKEQVSSIEKSSNGYVVTWAGVLGNANRWHFGENAVALISARDAAGKEVVHMEQPLDAVPPGRSLAFTGEAMSKVKPEHVKIDYRPASWRPVARIPSAFRAFPVSDVVTDKLDAGSYLVTGYISDPFRKAVSSLVVTALLRDDAGTLIGGGTTFVDDVRAEIKRRFVITVPGVKGKVADTDVSVRTWGATAKPYEELVAGGTIPVNVTKPTTKPFAKDRGYPLIGDRRP
ncbi:hypothetical protein [Microtetraspora sp. NBRC 16547]|uniref:hypothetical protein n=1 Tax=Microtetraspora sp. NBRC 16547 TaxID=3030993 RepID=UPI0024A4CD18|nr:hypothetical protein [Microtetraspora sp. NBRC 16547]GLX00680.1 hypothetical protein Misp02_47660 [Microtetraspora sp. NBRC 16547]